jgi:3,5-epimerase/4-reductase
MKWLVFGSNGWIGSMCVELLESQGEEVVHGTSRADNDKLVREELINVNPDRVLCLVGRTHGEGISTIDYLENPTKLVENIKDNLYAPIQLALQCNKMGIHMTYLGTGCIFTYQETSPGNGYTEDDIPDFFGSNYSIVKGFTDRLFHHIPVLNIRIRMPIIGEAHGRNFITKIVGYEKVVNIPNSMTVLPELLPLMIDMAKNKVVDTVNLTNPGPITHNEVLALYKKHVDPEYTWKNFTEEEQDTILKSKRSNNTLNTDKLVQMYPNVKNIHDSIEHELKGKL